MIFMKDLRGGASLLGCINPLTFLKSCPDRFPYMANICFSPRAKLQNKQKLYVSPILFPSSLFFAQTLISLRRRRLSHVRMRRKMAVTASQAVVVYQLFCIKENREEEAEKTSSTCSTNQGNQHFSHLVYCDTRINKIQDDQMPRTLAYRQNALGFTKMHCIL